MVHFDLDLSGSEFVPDPQTMAAWMSDAGHYWLFYVDDKSNVSISHGPYGARFRSDPTPRRQAEEDNATALRRRSFAAAAANGFAFTRKGMAGRTSSP